VREQESERVCERERVCVVSEREHKTRETSCEREGAREREI